MSLFRLDASIRGDSSTSQELANIVEGQWQANHQGDSVVRRDIGVDVLPADAWGLAVAASTTPEQSRTPDQRAATTLAATLADELLAADAFLFTTPLYNFGVSQHLKTWIDLILTDPRTGPAGPPPLAGKPTVLIATRGGSYAPGTPRDGWDHGTGYLRRILGDFWQAELTVVEREFTLMGEGEFAELAADSKEQAVHSAHEAGKALSTTG